MFGVNTTGARAGVDKGTPGCRATMENAAITIAVAPIKGRATRQFNHVDRSCATQVSPPVPSARSAPTTFWWKDSELRMSELASAAAKALLEQLG